MWGKTLTLTAIFAVTAGCATTASTSSSADAAPSTTGAQTTVAASPSLAVPGSPAPSSIARKPDARTSSYVAVVSAKNRFKLVVISKTNGKVMRELASAPVVDEWPPFADASLAPDGSVWAVRQDDDPNEYDPYASTLIHYTAKGPRTVLPYVQGVKVSPDGSHLALATLSPDGNHDKLGRYSLRLANSAGKPVRTLASQTFPVGEDGFPTLETPVPYPQTWLGNQRVVVKFGCCDAGSITIVPTTKTTSMNRWKSFFGDSQTTVLGRYGTDALLVARSTWGGKGTEQDPSHQTGFEAYRISERDMKGKRLRSVRTEKGLEAVAEKLLAGTGATRVWVGPATYPYAGAGKVVNIFP